MTKAKSQLNDNDGICESCNDPSTKGQIQEAVPVFLGGDLGNGTMWVCSKCKLTREVAERDKKLKEP